MLPIGTMKNKTISFQQRKGKFLKAIGLSQHLKREYNVNLKLRGMDTKYCAVCLEMTTVMKM